jgi:hypothetical protein
LQALMLGLDLLTAHGPWNHDASELIDELSRTCADLWEQGG